MLTSRVRGGLSLPPSSRSPLVGILDRSLAVGSAGSGREVEVMEKRESAATQVLVRGGAVVTEALVVAPGGGGVDMAKMAEAREQVVALAGLVEAEERVAASGESAEKLGDQE